MFSWMATTKTPDSIFVCNECGTVERKWHGQCPGCGEWNTLVEETPPAPRSGAGARRGTAVETNKAVAAAPGPIVEPVILSEVRAARIKRIPTGIGEFDRVLGGSGPS